MIGTRLNTRLNTSIGSVIGSGGDDEGPGNIIGVTQDQLSGIYCPANTTEWTTFMVASGIVTGNPSNLHLCQEASGNLADSIGSMPLTVASTPTYRQPFPGWSRMAVAITATTLQTFSAAAGVGPNPAIQSVAWGGWIATTVTPGGNRNLIVGTDTLSGLMITHNAANKLVSTCQGVGAVSIQNYTLATVYPVLQIYNKTASSFTLYTNLEILSGTFSVVADGNKGIGALAGNSDPSSKFLYLFEFSGSAAELSTASVRKLFQTAGWTVAW